MITWNVRTERALISNKKANDYLTHTGGEDKRDALRIVLGEHNATTHAAAKLDAGRRSSFGTDSNSAVAYHGTCVIGKTVW